MAQIDTQRCVCGSDGVQGTQDATASKRQCSGARYTLPLPLPFKVDAVAKVQLALRNQEIVHRRAHSACLQMLQCLCWVHGQSERLEQYSNTVGTPPPKFQGHMLRNSLQKCVP
jgi:hypothetical protein